MTTDKKPEPTPPPKKPLTDRERAIINAKRVAEGLKRRTR